MKHLKEVIKEAGYNKIYGRSCVFADQNADARHQNASLLKKGNNVFIKGDSTSKESIFFFPKKEDDFSSMIVGGLSCYYIKDNDFNNPIVWGLREYRKPPTLVFPRPKIIVWKNIDGRIHFMNEDFDDAMNVCIQNEDPEKIFQAMFDKTIVFKYEI